MARHESGADQVPDRDGGPTVEVDGDRPGGAGLPPEPLHAVDAAPRPIEPDPLNGDTRVASFFGQAFPAVDRFRALLTEQGVLRGLIGPGEVSRLWERHLLNSAAAAQFLPTAGRLIDVGSGAGLPGIVLAAMLPGVSMTLLEPMERRVVWLNEVVADLELANVSVRRGRAEELHGELEAEAVTARAVAPLDKLGRWTLPLLVQGGVLVALKGKHAADEVTAARNALRRLGAGPAEIFNASTIDGVDSTTVVRILRETVRGQGSKRPHGGSASSASRQGHDK